MNKQLLDELISCNADLSCDELKGVLVGCDEDGLLNIQIDTKYSRHLPGLYHRGQWNISAPCGDYHFQGEVMERYIKNNVCIIDVRVISGIYKDIAEKQLDFDKDREAVIITSSGEKLIVNILRLNPNRCLIKSGMQITENSKVWLRYKDLAIASLTTLEHNSEVDGYIYNLDFSVETLEKRGRIAELILNDKL